MVLLESDPFLTELTKLYENHRESGTVWVTLKRSSLKKRKKRKANDGNAMDVSENVEYFCLVRATDGKKTISTTLAGKDNSRFQAAYATILKAHMDALKKKERKEKKEKVVKNKEMKDKVVKDKVVKEKVKKEKEKEKKASAKALT